VVGKCRQASCGRQADARRRAVCARLALTLKVGCPLGHLVHSPLDELLVHTCIGALARGGRACCVVRSHSVPQGARRGERMKV